MGLSTEERYAKIYDGIAAINNYARFIGPPSNDAYLYEDKFLENLSRLYSKIDLLWNAFLGSTQNSSFWLTGSSLISTVKSSEEGPWSAAICSLCHKSNSYIIEEDLELEVLSVRGLLNHAKRGKILTAVYDIFSASELLVYAIRRYDDQVWNSLQALSKIVSDIQGICFSIFTSDEVFGQAYVLNRTLEIIYGRTHLDYKTDPVGEMLNQLAMHHKLSRPMIDGSLKECLTWHEQIASTSSPPAPDRLVLAVVISGRRLHSDESFAELIKTAKEKGILLSKKYIDIIKDQFKKNKKARLKYKKNTDSAETSKYIEFYALHRSFPKQERENT